MQLSPKQKEFWNAPFHRWNVKHGATRSGKTYLDYFMIPRRIRERAGKDGLTVLLGNTKGTLQRNVIEPMQEIYGATLVSSIRADNTALMFGERVHCLGADSKKHVDRLRGASIKYCYGDEVVSWEHEVFEMLKSRLDKPYSTFDGTCNPGAPNHWFKSFIDSGADIYAQQYSLADNPFLDDTVRAEMMREHAGVFYDRYILGLWVRAEGAIYPMFAPDKHVVDAPPRILRTWVAVDYGHTNATVFLLLGEGEDGRVYVLREYYHPNGEAGQKSPKQYSADMRKFLVESKAYLDGEFDGVYVDPSALGFINQLREDGFPDVRGADNQVLRGIQLVSSLMEYDLLRVHRSCKHTIDELQGYAWDAKAAERGEDKPVKSNDHCCDALRYGAMADKRVWQRRLTRGAVDKVAAG